MVTTTQSHVAARHVAEDVARVSMACHVAMVDETIMVPCHHPARLRLRRPLLPFSPGNVMTISNGVSVTS